MVSISYAPTVQYWQSLGSLLDKAKDNIPEQCRIVDTCFPSLATIGGNLFTIHPKNHNHVQKDVNDLLSVIIILVPNVHDGETVFYDGVNMSDIEKRAHILKHSNGRFVVGAFYIILYEVYIWTVHRSIISLILHKSILIHFVHKGTRLYENIYIIKK